MTVWDAVEEEDALGSKTVYQSDAFDRVIKIAWPNGRAVEVQYATQSAAALPTSVQINHVVLGGQTFDGLDRLGRKSLRPEHWDATLKSPTSTQDRQYFLSGPLKVEQVNVGPDASFTTQAAYSMRGKLQTYTDVYGQEYHYEYDVAGRLGVLNLGTLRLSYCYVLTYDDFGREMKRAVSQGDQLLYRPSQSYGMTGLAAARHLEDGKGTTFRDFIKNVFPSELSGHIAGGSACNRSLPAIR
ncbi:hypothetical protein ACHAQJ_007451 [Trichoderma viride]